jgi:putative SOS response-associated peptidase YedK
MCNDYEQHVAWAEYCKVMQDLALKRAQHQGPLDLPQAVDVRIGDTAPVMRLAGDEVELAPMRFGIPPSGPKAPPLFNWKSEGRNFANSNRCLVPASAFFEFTGTKIPESKAPVRPEGCPVPRRRGGMEARGRQSASGVRDAHDCAWAGRGPSP